MTCPPCTHDCNEGRNCPAEKGNNMTQESLAQTQEPVAWQFFQGGKWHNGMEFHDHRKHTIAAGTPVRDLYAAPPQRTEQLKACVYCGQLVAKEKNNGV